MGAMASQIISLTIGYSTVYSGADQRKHQSSASPAFVGGIHRWPVNSPHKGPVTRKMFPFDDVIMDYHGTSLLHDHSPRILTIVMFRFIAVYTTFAPHPWESSSGIEQRTRYCRKFMGVNLTKMWINSLTFHKIDSRGRVCLSMEQVRNLCALGRLTDIYQHQFSVILCFVIKLKILMLYIDVIMGAMASQITSLMIVSSTVYSGADLKKTIIAPLYGEFTGDRTGEFPAQMASNAENVSI